MIKKYLYTIGTALLLFTSAQAQKDKDKSKSPLPKKLESLKDSASYAMGVSIGQSLNSRYAEMDIALITKGMNEAFVTSDTLMKPEVVTALINSYIKQRARIQTIGNREAGEKFLKENAGREGVIKTVSGLQYIILKEGTGPKPASDNRVKVHYFGKLLNGQEFDNSYKRGQPAEFNVNGVIKGWTEALQLMSPGSKYKLFIPAELGYGDSGMGASIPPASVLIFEVELLEIMN